MTAKRTTEDRWDTWCTECLDADGHHRQLNEEPQEAKDAISLRQMHGNTFHDGLVTSKHARHDKQTVFCADCETTVYEGFNRELALQYRNVHNEAFHSKPEAPEEEIGPPAA